MPDNDLAQVGQQVVDAIVASYHPDADDNLGLALHPGQAIADQVVQAGATGGQSNPLVLSEWIADQYDYPMLLKVSDDTTVVSSMGSTISGKAGYAAMVPWATPAVPPDAPTYARVSSLISQARQSLGANPDTLPFECEPGDFAEPGSTGWHVFDTSQTSSHSEGSTTPGRDFAVRASPELWQMRALPATVLDALPARVETHAASTEFVRQSIKTLDPSVARPPLTLQHAVLLQRAQHVAPLHAVASVEADAPSVLAAQVAAPASRGFALRRRLGPIGESLLRRPARDAPADVELPAPAVDATPQFVQPDRRHALAGALVHVQIADFADAPAVTQTTTESSSLHVHFEYQLVWILRRISGTRWWRDELIKDRDWYVPGMRKGAMFDSPEGDVTLCLPRALIVVRNVSITGSWTAEARTTLRDQITYVGPFLVAPPSDAEESTSAGTSFAVLGAGIQVIGELCAPLPPLPPVSDPSLPV